jgi:G3E family GTPase
MSRPRYIMVGGFLGAGKTTAISQLARRLTDAGRRVGLITNDQSHGLADTRLLTSQNYPVEEITGGCFCCRFNSLVDAAEALSARQAPDVFLAEPVGSCTDLKATVEYPLRRMYGASYDIAPYSVLVDPVRAARVLGLQTDKSFSEKVLYIYRKQLEEADVIVINKTDLLSDEQRLRLQQAIGVQFPRARIRSISARGGIGIEDWLAELMTGEDVPVGPLEIDYDVYAEGEAQLGWLNGQFVVEGSSEFDGNHLLQRLAEAISAALGSASFEIAHLKMTLAPSDGNDLALINMTRRDAAPEASHRLAAPLVKGELILNLRAEGDPDAMRAIVEELFATRAMAGKLTIYALHLESFRPGRPVPTHRLTSV